MENFKVGDTVQWASSANGSWKEKKGIVEAVVPAYESGQKYMDKVAKRYGIKPPSVGFSRDSKSYIVRVPSKTGKGGKLYWPRTKALETDE